MHTAQIDIFTPTETTLTWREVLQGERAAPYFQQLTAFVDGERSRGKTIYPKSSDVFNALALTPFDSVKVVIIGQDPYHGPNQAHGLCFSVLPGVPAPPSLLNIFQELRDDLAIPMPNHGCLEKWARQGVLLLNAVLTVEAGQPQSHAGKGWETFTDKVISQLNNRRKNLVFLLWGSQAQKKCEGIDQRSHLVLKAPHPSPLSAHRGFFGCRHFSSANKYLENAGLSPIDWAL